MGFIEGKIGRIIVARLFEGEDLISKIKDVAEKAGIDAGTLILIGALKKARLGYYIGKGEYKPNEFEGPLEIASCIGNTTKRDGETIIHAHMVISDSEGNAFGGHLLEGNQIYVTGELFIFEIKDVELKRVLDEKLRLYLLKL